MPVCNIIYYKGTIKILEKIAENLDSIAIKREDINNKRLTKKYKNSVLFIEPVTFKNAPDEKEYGLWPFFQTSTNGSEIKGYFNYLYAGFIKIEKMIKNDLE